MIEEINMDYKGYIIANVQKPIDCKCKQSGHEWTEYKPMATLEVSIPDGHVLSKNYPKFRTVKSAKKWIDENISFVNKFYNGNVTEFFGKITPKKRKITL